MSDLPSGWVWTPLGEVCSAVSKVDPSTFDRKQFRYVDIGCVDGSAQAIADAPSIDCGKAPSRARQLIRAGDTVFSTVRPYLRKIAYVSGNLDGEVASTGFCILRPNQAINDRYLFYSVISDSFIDQVSEKQRGVSYPAVRPNEVLETLIPLPPLAEQRRIVDALEDHLSRLDVAKATLQSLIQRVRRLDDLSVDDVVLGRSLGLPLTSPPSNDLRGKYERFDYHALPPLPEGWEWKLAESLCNSINSGSTPAADLMQQDHGEVPFLKVYNIDPAGRIDFSKNPTFISTDTHTGQLRRSVVLPGDVVTNIVGPPLGKSAVVPASHPEWNHNQAIVSFRAGDEIQADWLAACLRSPFIIGLLKSTARATAGQFNVALSTCRELPLPRPPVEIQRKLLTDLSDHHSLIQHAGESIRAASLRSAALRRALLRAAFNGELVDQDLNDEPAQVALDRVRNETNSSAKRTRRRPASTSIKA